MSKFNLLIAFVIWFVPALFIYYIIDLDQGAMIWMIFGWAPAILALLYLENKDGNFINY